MVSTPSKRLKKFAKSTLLSFKVQWDVNHVSEYFHATCWDGLIEGNGVSRAESRLLEHVAETTECYDTIEKVREVVRSKIIPIMRTAKRVVCFTGAGVSAAAGIPTYRGATGIDTLAEVSAGPVGEDSAAKRMKAGGESSSSSIEEGEEERKRGGGSATAIEKREAVKGGDEEEEEEEEEYDGDAEYTRLRPTLAHKCLVELYKRNKLHYCITQNCDDLHSKAGLPREITSDLHGNVFVEYCERCKREYRRDYCVDLYSTDCLREPWAVKCKACSWNHYTGRVCEIDGCKGRLRDTIVNFGDSLHQGVLGGLDGAETASRGADLSICLGSSLTVSPAFTLPSLSKTTAIINLQSTALDEEAGARMWTTCDIFFTVLFEEMGLPLPEM